MLIPRHWVRATAERADPASAQIHRTTAYGYSDVSAAEAQRDALARAGRVLDWLVSDGALKAPDAYGYGDERPLREQIVREFVHGGAPAAIVTRNAYGALVLNAAHVMFIDVDEAAPTALGGFVGRLFGRARRDPLATLKAALAETPGVGARIYRTAAGWRALVTSQLVEPRADATDELMVRCGADPRYRALCRVQQCFRARLTPKPWRCGVEAPTLRYPFADAGAEAKFAAWLQGYERASGAYAVCEFVEALGAASFDPVAAAVLREHDAATLRPGKKLA